MKDRIAIITEFYEKKAKPDDQYGINFEVHTKGRKTEIIYRAHNETIYTIAINPNLNWIEKYIGKKVIPFTNEELKFFDNLGFDLFPMWAKAAKQNIDDWFKESEVNG